MVSLGQQYSVGDQYSDHRYNFWNEGMQICPVCKSKKMNKTSDCAGVRNNGDAYGTDVFTCGDCQWCTSFQYDDAAETYYYETRAYQARWELERNPIVYRDIKLEDKTKYGNLFRQHRMDIIMVSGCLKDERIKKDQIEEFLKELSSA